jgi:hypothetical protein
MFKLTDAYKDITVDFILSKVSEYELWRYYCLNFEKIDKPFCSELYDDKNPACRIFYSNNNHLLYKDFGDGGVTYNVFEYIQAKYICDFKQCLEIIAKDFNLRESTVILNKETKKIIHDVPKVKEKSRIEIVPRPFKLIDYTYWQQYSIPLSMLNDYDVFACKHVYLYKNDNLTVFNENYNNPMYAYRFTNNGSYSYKIYKPYEQKNYKWLFSGGSQEDIEGYDQLDLHGNILILTKSLKDIMVYRLCGYNAISLQGETNKLSSELVNKLLKRFDKILINYDNDEEGVRGSNRIYNQYGFKFFFIDDTKDISDYCKKYGLFKTKIMINNKIKANG